MFDSLVYLLQLKHQHPRHGYCKCCRDVGLPRLTQMQFAAGRKYQVIDLSSKVDETNGMVW